MSGSKQPGDSGSLTSVPPISSAGFFSFYPCFFICYISVLFLNVCSTKHPGVANAICVEYSISMSAELGVVFSVTGVSATLNADAQISLFYGFPTLPSLSRGSPRRPFSTNKSISSDPELMRGFLIRHKQLQILPLPGIRTNYPDVDANRGSRLARKS